MRISEHYRREDRKQKEEERSIKAKNAYWEIYALIHIQSDVNLQYFQIVNKLSSWCRTNFEKD